MRTTFSRRRVPSRARRTAERTPELRPSRPWCGYVVREERPAFATYDAEGSERRALGSIEVAAGARWMATLTVPIPDDGVAFLHLERSGAAPLGYRGGEERADFSAPVAEVEALVALLAGIVAQARRDGVLSAP